MQYIAQVFGLCILIFIPFVYKKQSTSQFYIWHIIINILKILQYACLSAWTGMLTSISSGIKNTVYLCYSRKDKKAPIYFMFLFMGISLLLSSFGYSGIFSILPMISTVITGYGNWQHKYKVMCTCNFIALLLGVLYNIIVGAYGGLPAYAIEFIAIVRGVQKHNKSEECIK